MARELTTIRLILTSANTDLNLDTLRAEYRVTDGDLAKLGSVIVSGVDTTDTVTGMWDEALSQINAVEGL